MARKIGSYLEHPCPECGGIMVLRESKYGLFYGCLRFRDGCRATHGAHSSGEPLGIPADAGTKTARIKAHSVFDKLWKSDEMTRSAAYVWMRDAMDLLESEAHIGRFTKAQCQELIEKCEQYAASVEEAGKGLRA